MHFVSNIQYCIGHQRYVFTHIHYEELYAEQSLRVADAARVCVC